MEKGGKEHHLPAHPKFEVTLDKYLQILPAKDDKKDDKQPALFRTVNGLTGELTTRRLTRQDGWKIIRRRAIAAKITSPIGCHTFRATGITAYLANGGTLEKAQQIAAHNSVRTTKLYDRREDSVTLTEVERVLI